MTLDHSYSHKATLFPLILVSSTFIQFSFPEGIPSLTMELEAWPEPLSHMTHAGPSSSSQLSRSGLLGAR